MRDSKQFAQNLIDFIKICPTVFHAADAVKNKLLETGFTGLFEADSWNIKPGGKYFILKNGSAVCAFIAGKKSVFLTGFRIMGAHLDSPGFRLKPAPEMASENSYIKLNTEVYGGPILNTWLDRPLSIAGRALLKGKEVMKPESRLFDFGRPVCVIPNVAIHLNPEVNKGQELNKQNDLLPLIGMQDGGDVKGVLLKEIAGLFKISETDILDADLFLYPVETGCLAGLHEEWISSPRLDDLEAVHAGLTAFLETEDMDSTAVLALFNHEEVGSSTAQGADSPFLSSVLERLAGSREDFFRALSSSFFVSADAGHAVHPNQGDKTDPTSRPLPNKGIIIKQSASMSYSTDGSTAAVFESICKEAGVNVQRFVNRSDIKGGSTIGPITASQLGIASVDIGIPLLAMHSIRELCGVQDHAAFADAIAAFYKN